MNRDAPSITAFSKFDLNVLIAERTEEMQRIAGNRKITLLLTAYHPIMADRERIAQVLTNLLSNAIKYSPDGAEVKVSSEQNEHEVTVRVADAGIGILEKYHDKIFDRFYRVSDNSLGTYPGMGLGLYISAEIIRNHGGSISVKVKKGRGLYFSLHCLQLIPKELSKVDFDQITNNNNMLNRYVISEMK